MRVVLDSNVIIAAYAAHGLCHSLFELCLADHTVVVSQDILDEVGDKLQNKIKIPSKIVKEILVFLKKNAHFERPASLSSDSCRDPDDVRILGLAVSARCEYLVSGDQDLLALGSFQGVPVLSPRQFYDKLRQAS